MGALVDREHGEERIRSAQRRLAGLRHGRDPCLDRGRDIARPGGGVTRRRAPSRASHRDRRRALLPARPRSASTRSSRAREEILPVAAPEVGGERGHGRGAGAKLLDHEQQHTRADGEHEDEVEVIAPGIPGAPRAQDRVVEVMQSPEEEGDRKSGRRGGAGVAAIAPEDHAGPERGPAQEEHRRQRRQHEIREPEDRDPGPDDGEGERGEIHRAPRDPVCKDRAPTRAAPVRSNR